MGKYLAPVHDHLILPARVRLSLGDEREFAIRGRSAPAPVSIRFIIDTGAKRTTLVPDIVDRLAPSLGTSARLVTPVGSVQTNLVWLRLEFPEAGLAAFPHVLVARHPMPRMLSQFHGLLGRDLLQQIESFEYLGRRGYYALRDTAGWLGWLRRCL